MNSDHECWDNIKVHRSNNCIIGETNGLIVIMWQFYIGSCKDLEMYKYIYQTEVVTYMGSFENALSAFLYFSPKMHPLDAFPAKCRYHLTPGAAPILTHSCKILPKKTKNTVLHSEKVIDSGFGGFDGR